MSPEGRSQRIEAAARTIFGFASPTSWDTVSGSVQEEYRKRAIEALDAADEAVPLVPNVAEPGCAYVVTPEMKRLADEHAALEERVEKAEAAARDFAQALADIRDGKSLVFDGSGRDRVGVLRHREFAANALVRYPSFSGEEGTER